MSFENWCVLACLMMAAWFLAQIVRVMDVYADARKAEALHRIMEMEKRNA